MYPRDVTCVCGKNFSYYAEQKCQLSTAEMNLHRVADMLGISTKKCSFLLVMTTIVYCSVFSNIFDCNRYFCQLPDDCFA